MIGLMLSASVVSLEAVPARAPAESEIVVIGRKLQLTKGLITTNVLTGRSACKVEKSSGDLRVDNAVCEIAITCLRQGRDGKAFAPCVKDGRQRFLAKLNQEAEQDHDAHN
jgi:hypothetical protein